MCFTVFFLGNATEINWKDIPDPMIFKIRCYCENMCCFFVVDFSVAELDHELLGSIPFVLRENWDDLWTKVQETYNYNSLAIELRLD